MNKTKTLLAGAAAAGLITGSMGLRAFAAGEPTPAGVLLPPVEAKEAASPGIKDVKAGTPARAKEAARLTRDKRRNHP